MERLKMCGKIKIVAETIFRKCERNAFTLITCQIHSFDPAVLALAQKPNFAWFMPACDHMCSSVNLIATRPYAGSPFVTQGPCSNNVCTLCRSSCYFPFSHFLQKYKKKTSHFLDPGMCVICVEFLPFQWRIPFHSLHFSGHKPIVWSLADCLINEPFLLLFFSRTHKKEKNPLWSERVLLSRWCRSRIISRNKNARRFIELIDVAFNDQID